MAHPTSDDATLPAAATGPSGGPVVLRVSEILDRVSILEIRARKTAHPAHRAAATAEVAVLLAHLGHRSASPGDLDALRSINGELWDFESRIRAAIRDHDDALTLHCARRIVALNDQRSAIKADVDARCAETNVDRKDYG